MSTNDNNNLAKLFVEDLVTIFGHEARRVFSNMMDLVQEISKQEKYKQSGMFVHYERYVSEKQKCYVILTEIPHDICHFKGIINIILEYDFGF